MLSSSDRRRFVGGVEEVSDESTRLRSLLDRFEVSDDAEETAHEQTDVSDGAHESADEETDITAGGPGHEGDGSAVVADGSDSGAANTDQDGATGGDMAETESAGDDPAARTDTAQQVEGSEIDGELPEPVDDPPRSDED